MKQFYIQYGIGTAKYVVNHHDGKSTYRDGSKFFGIALFSNKRKLNVFVRLLRKAGYIEKGE
jgi:hypothetical protein